MIASKLVHSYPLVEIPSYRMENTQICEQIIKDFNGEKIPGNMHAILCSVIFRLLHLTYPCIYEKM